VYSGPRTASGGHDARPAGTQPDRGRLRRDRSANVARDVREQPVEPGGQRSEGLAVSRPGVGPVQRVKRVGGARVGDLHEAELMELVDRTLDLAAAPEDPHFRHGNEHALTPPDQARRR
jgi:hypothetical protein